MSPLSINLFKRSEKQTLDAQDAENASSSDIDSPTRSPARRSRLMGRIRGSRHITEDALNLTESVDETSSPETRAPPLVIAFVNSLDAEKTSNFLTWFLYYDVVQMPESPSQWYRDIDSMELRGWIALGSFLSTDPKYGLDLVVLDSICDRLKLRKQLIQEIVVQLANPQKMAFTRLARVSKIATKYELSEMDLWENMKSVLQDMKRLAAFVKPTLGSVFADWQPLIIERLRGFLDVVVLPRIAAVRHKPAAPTNKTANEERELAYLFELMKEERPVPLVRYGIVPSSCTPSTTAMKLSEAVPALDDAALNVEDEAELSYTPKKMRADLRLVRTQNQQLVAASKYLIECNEELSRKLKSVSRAHPELFDKTMHVPLPTKTTAAVPGLPEVCVTQPTPLYHQQPAPSRAPLPFTQIRLSQFDPEIPSRGLTANRRITIAHPPVHPGQAAHPPSDFGLPSSSPESPESEGSDHYSGVFRAFDDKPLPLALIDPATGDIAKLPRSRGSFDLRSAASMEVIDTAQHPRNRGTVNLRSAVGIEMNDSSPVASSTAWSPPVASSSVTSSATISTPSPSGANFRSASDGSRKVTPNQLLPGPGNSLAELANRKIGRVTPILAPATPRRVSTIPIVLVAARNALVSVTQRQTDTLEHDAIIRMRRRSHSLGNVLDAFRQRGWVVKEEEEKTPDISTNF